MAHTVGVTLVGTVGVTLGHTLWYVGVTIRLYFITLGYTVGNTLVCGCGCGCVHVGVGVTLGGGIINTLLQTVGNVYHRDV